MQPSGSSTSINTTGTTGSNGSANFRTVKLMRSSLGYGMKIRSDPHIRGVRVSDLSPHGAAAQSGQIFIGDIIVEINGRPMLDAQHQDVVAALVERDSVALVLQAGDAVFPAVPAVQRKRVRLQRLSTGLGLKIMAEEKYAKVIELIPNGAAAQEGSIAVGDHIIEVNGVKMADIPKEEMVEAIACRGQTEVIFIVETPAPKRSKSAALKKLFSSSSTGSKTPSKKDLYAAPPSGAPSPGNADTIHGSNVWTQVAEQWAMELQEQLRQSRAIEEQQAKDIGRLEAQVSELSNEASAAAALRLELQAARQAYDDLRKQTMRTDESELRKELLTMQFKLADLEMGRVQQEAKAAETAAKLHAAEKEISRLREARAEIARLNAMLSAEPTETEA